MTKTLRPLCVFLACLAIAACGSSPPPKVYHCSGAAKIEVANADLFLPLDPKTKAPVYGMALPKGIETDIQLRVTDAAGAECDPGKATLALDDSSQVTIVKHGDVTVLKAAKDLFDANGQEPMTMLRISYDGVPDYPTAVYSVLSLADKWDVTVDFPAGPMSDGGSMLDLGMFEFQQSGRTLKYANRSEAGSVIGADLTLNQSSDPMAMGLVLKGTVAPDRSNVSGTWMSGMMSGTWTAARLTQ